MIDFLCNLLARFLAQPRVARRIIGRARRTPYRNIASADGTDVYMERWWLFNPYDADYVGRIPWLPSIRLHHIRRPDQDRHLHDHPWNARTFVLLGAYVEEREGGQWFTRRAGDSAPLKFGEYHRIHSVAHGVGAMTLFVTFRKRGPWGFLVDGEKVPAREYLKGER